MKINTQEFLEAVRLGQDLTSGDLKPDIEELRMLSILIRDHKVYVLAQGDTGFSTVRMLTEIGYDGDIEKGDYIISGGKISRVLGETEDEEVEVRFKDDEVELVTEFGVTRYNSLGSTIQTEYDIATNYDHIFEDIQNQISYVQESGSIVDAEIWKEGLGVLRSAIRDTEDMALLFHQDHVSISAGYLNIRYRTDFPYELPLPLEIAYALRHVVNYDPSETKSTKDGEAFTYVTDKVFFSVFGLRSAFVATETDYNWDIETERGVEVVTEELRRVIRVSDIFLESRDEDIILEWKYADNKLRALNSGDTESGADLSIQMDTDSEKEEDKIKVLGDYLQKILILTEDDTVQMEILERDGVHLVFSEGDARLQYVPSF